MSTPTNLSPSSNVKRHRLVVLSSTYPLTQDDTSPSFVKDLCEGIARYYEIIVICPHSASIKCEKEINGIKVNLFRYAPMKLESLSGEGGILARLKQQPARWMLVPFFILGMTFALIKTVRDFKPDVIHGHWLIPQGIAIWLASRIMALPPVIMTAHGSDIFSLNSLVAKWLKSRIVRSASHLTVVSRAMIEPALSLGKERCAVSVAPMGAKFPEARQQHKRVPGRILFVGRLIEGKGLQHIIAIFPEILAVNPDAHLQVIGDGPEREALGIMARSLGVDARIKFLGSLPHESLAEHYRSASLCCAPFTAPEGLGLVPLEAISEGCPVLAGDVPAQHDIFPAKLRSMFLIDPTDHQQLAIRVTQLLATPPCEDTMDALRQHCIERYSWENVTKRYLEIFGAVIKSRITGS